MLAEFSDKIVSYCVKHEFTKLEIASLKQIVVQTIVGQMTVFDFVHFSIDFK